MNLHADPFKYSSADGKENSNGIDFCSGEADLVCNLLKCLLGVVGRNIRSQRFMSSGKC